MDRMTNISPWALETLLICSVRYAVGRSTYIVSDVISIILKNIDDVSTTCLEILHRDIKEEVDAGNYGMFMDLECWKSLLKTLEDKIKQRNKNEQ